MRIDERIMKAFAAALVAVCAAFIAPGTACAQGGAAASPELASQINRRFNVLPITGGVVLTPRAPMAGVQSIELSNGTIAIDGAPVSGAELRQKMGADADEILQLSYRSPAEQRAIAGSSARPEAPPSAAPSGPPPSPAPPEPPPSPRGRDDRRFDFQFPPRTHGGDVVHIGRSTRVEAGEVVNGDAVSIGGSVAVLGEVRGDVVSIGGTVDLGPAAVVSQNVVVVGGRLNRDPGAKIGGEVQEVGWGTPRFNDWWRRSWNGPSASGLSFAAPLALIAQIIRIGVLCLLAVLVVLVAGNFVERIGQRAAAEPLKAGAVGFLAQILFLPLLIVTIILLVVTIIGIPLLVLIPFAILGLVLVALVGFSAVALRVGQLVGARLSWTAGPYMLTVTGVLVMLGPVLLARLIGLGGFPLSFVSFLVWCVGVLVEYVAWTIGFGAVALTRFSKPSATLTTNGS